MNISVRLNKDDSELFRNYAKMHGITMSELIRQSVIEKIEDEHDLEAYYRALAKYEANPVTYSLDEIEERLGLK